MNSALPRMTVLGFFGLHTAVMSTSGVLPIRSREVGYFFFFQGEEEESGGGE